MAFISGDLRTQADVRSDLPQPVVLALEYVQRLWRDSASVSPSLGELAHAAHVSRGHLCRLFQETLSCGPLQALRMLRVDSASELLARSNLQIQEVARLSGFENPFHFSRCFKEAFGMSPRAYRQKAVQQAVTPHTRLQVVRRLFAPRWTAASR